MVAVFLGLGFLFLFTKAFIDNYPPPMRYWIGSVLWLWALFRGITSWLRLKQLKKEEEDEDIDL
ncbi:MAG: hypothetical protein Fur0041_18790 [Bacteroidia bacterium]